MVSIWLVFLSRRSLPKQARALADGPRIHPKRSNSALAAVAYDIPIFCTENGARRRRRRPPRRCAPTQPGERTICVEKI